MALRFMDGFSHYATVDLAKKYDSVDPTHVITTGGRYSANALSCSGSLGTTGTRKRVSALGPTGVVGFNTSYPTIGTSPLGYFRLFQVLSNTTPILTFLIRDSANGNGTIRVVSGDHDGTVLGTSTTVAVNAATQRHLEVRWYLQASTGQVEIRKDGVVILLLSGLSFGFITWNTIALFPNVGELLSHFYMMDGTGTRLNYFLGPDAEVRTTLPTATVPPASIVEGIGVWSPSTGTRESCVDDNPPNGDTDYIRARSSSLQSKFTCGTVSAADAVHAIQVNAIARRLSEAYSPLICTSVNGLRYGANQLPGLTYTHIWDLYELDAETGLPWTIAGVNAASYGVRRNA